MWLNLTQFKIAITGSSAESSTCPETGEYQVTGAGLIGASMARQAVISWAATVGLSQEGCEDATYTKLKVGCTSKDTLELHTTCAHSGMFR